MGRTVLTATQLIQRIQAEHWGKFRRALRHQDQEVLDRLFDRALYHAQAMAYASLPIPMEPILISMLIELQKDLMTVQAELKHATSRRPELQAVPEGRNENCAPTLEKVSSQSTIADCEE